MQQDLLNISPIFKALARPSMIMGVDYDYFYIATLVVMLVFIYTDNFLAFALFLPLYLIGWVLCQIDPHIFKLISARASIGVIKNKKIWQCQSYEAF